MSTGRNVQPPTMPQPSVRASPGWLARLEERWKLGIPTIAAFAARELARAEAIIRAWADERGLTPIVHTGPPQRLAQAAFAACVESRDPIAALAQRIAERNGANVEALLARLRDDSTCLGPEELAALGPDAAVGLAASALLGPWRTLDQLWERATTLAATQPLGDEGVAAGFARLMRPEPVPLLTATASDAETALSLAAAGQRLVEAIPQLALAFVFPEQTWRALAGCDDHCWALVREGFLGFTEAERGALREHDRTEIAVSRERERSELVGLRRQRGLSQEVQARAKSLAERLLFEALGRRATTAGRFTLNGRIDVVFGSCRAEIDLLDRDLAIAVEVDGFHHFRDREAYRRDRRKDVLLQQEGYLVIRALADDVLDRLEETVDDIALAVGRRLGTLR